jgi:hypothetical protein
VRRPLRYDRDYQSTSRTANTIVGNEAFDRLFRIAHKTAAREHVRMSVLEVSRAEHVRFGRMRCNAADI